MSGLPEWWRRPLIAVDLETTGVDPHTDRIVTASVLMVDPVTRTSVKTASWLVHPGVEIPEGATRVHGVTTQMSESGTPAPVAVAQITETIENWSRYLSGIVVLADGSLAEPSGEYRPREVGIVAFNARFDMTMLHAEMRRHWDEQWVPHGFVIDPMVIDSGMDRYRKGRRTLAATCEHYGVELTDEDAHTSSGDALAAAHLAYVMGERFPAVGRIVLEALVERETLWCAERDRSYARYLARQAGVSECEDRGEFAPVDGWPIMADPSGVE
jgi:DNA polymerase-3 subunit epsilon